MLGLDRSRRLWELGKVGLYKKVLPAQGLRADGTRGAWESPVFLELVARGTALRQSKGQGKWGELCPGVISMSYTLLFNDPIAEGKPRRP